uniref:Nuclear cap-binding protein subunit 3 n=1 Tax=Panagrellus redivivus TaxID=6233 RepID=A0A7E4VXL9_PANRE
MEDITFGLEEDLELDYEAEEALRRARGQETVDVDPAAPSEPSAAVVEEIKPEVDESIAIAAAEKAANEAKRMARKRRSSPTTWARGVLGADDEIYPSIAKKPRGKLRYQPDLLPSSFFPDETDPDEPPPEVIDDHPALKKSEVASVFDSLDTDIYDTEYPLNTVLVRGIEGLDHYVIEKIFAEYHPHIALFADSSEAIVQFKLARIATKMLVGMSKPIKRVRKPKQVEEEGEIVDDEHEGQEHTNADGDVVTLVNEPKRFETGPQDSDDETPAEEEVVEVDVTKTKVPKGKWRIVTKHVPAGRVIFVRYAKTSDIQKANRNSANTQYRTDRSLAVSKTGAHRVKAGINVFDNTGKELPWNFEHDTRIFNDPSLAKIETTPVSKAPQEEVLQIGDQEVRSRGRGTKKALNLRFDSSDESESEPEAEEAMPDVDDLEDYQEPVTETAKPKPSDLFLSSVLSKK